MGPFLYVTDLHGNRPKYERTLSLALETGAWLVVNGGDMSPHGRMQEDQAAFLREFLDPHLAKYQAAGIRYFGIPANDDLRAHDAQFDEICSRYSLVENLAGRKVRAGPYVFIGFSLVTDFPFRLKDRARRDSGKSAFPEQFGGAILSRPGGWEEIPDWEAYARALPTIEEELAALPAPEDPDRVVYVIHGPPPAALKGIPAFLENGAHHKYVPDAGLPSLRKAFEEKLRAENGIDAAFGRRIFVTAGANQGFVNALLCLCDPGDEVILLSPYYFNHEMAVRLAGCRVVCVPVDERLQPDLPAIAAAITERTRAIVTVSPNNPTGAVYPRETLAAIHPLCAERRIYHVSDEAYEYFTYDGARHFSPGSLGGEHVISLYSLSKAYGMASWRVGFLVAPEHLSRDLMKI